MDFHSGSAPRGRTPRGQVSVVAVGPDGASLLAVPDGPDDGAERFTALRPLAPGTVLVAPGERGDDTYRVLNTLIRVGALPGCRVHSGDVPPTLLALLAAVLGTGLFGPGDSLEVLRELRAAGTTVALTDRVGRLRDPVPSLGQHLRGSFPRALFVIDVGGDRVLTGVRSLNRLRRLHTAAIALAAAPDPRSRQWMEILADRADDPRPLLLDHVPPPAVPWRQNRWAELTGLPMPAEEFAAQLAGHLARRICGTCGEPVSGVTCPFCGTATGRAAA
jgi:hypothetical protein